MRRIAVTASNDTNGRQIQKRRTNWASQWTCTDTNLLYWENRAKWRQDTQQRRNTKSWKSSGGDYLSQLFYCERYGGPVRRFGAHLVQHPQALIISMSATSEQLTETIWNINRWQPFTIALNGHVFLLFQEKLNFFRFTPDWCPFKEGCGSLWAFGGSVPLLKSTSAMPRRCKQNTFWLLWGYLLSSTVKHKITCWGFFFLLINVAFTLIKNQ